MNEQMQEHREEINPRMTPVEKFIVGGFIVIILVAILALLGIHF